MLKQSTLINNICQNNDIYFVRALVAARVMLNTGDEADIKEPKPTNHGIKNVM